MHIFGVRLETAGQLFYTKSTKLPIHIGEQIIVEASGCDILTTVRSEYEMTENEVPDTALPVVRMATIKDTDTDRQNDEDAKDVVKTATIKANSRKLDMKIIRAKYTLDRRKVMIFFTATHRVDFRELVKDLAGIFRTRIELRQVGVRDEARILGGIGPCGRTLCCSTFLGQFVPVSIKMAKDQDLSLNPTKISGLCGRLLCCLEYENDSYEQAKREMPDYGTIVKTPDGKGRIIGLNLLSQMLRVRLEGHEVATNYQLEEITPV